MATLSSRARFTILSVDCEAHHFQVTETEEDLLLEAHIFAANSISWLSFGSVCQVLEFVLVTKMSIANTDLGQNLVSVLLLSGKLVHNDPDWSVKIEFEHDFVAALRSLVLALGYDLSCRMFSSRLRSICKDLMPRGGNASTLLTAFCRLTSRAVGPSLAKVADASAKRLFLERAVLQARPPNVFCSSATGQSICVRSHLPSGSLPSSVVSSFPVATRGRISRNLKNLESSDSRAIVPRQAESTVPDSTLSRIRVAEASKSVSDLVAISMNLLSTSTSLIAAHECHVAKLKKSKAALYAGNRVVKRLQSKYKGALAEIERLKAEASFKKFGKKRRRTAVRENISVLGGYRLALLNTVGCLLVLL